MKFLLVGLCLLAVRLYADDFQRGMELAREGRWEEARAAFEAGQHANPLDRRFAVELAGVAFQRKDYGAARHYLRRSLATAPEDQYANDFLATVFLLDGNLEAALKYWNRIGKPRIENVLEDPRPRVDVALLDRAFLFSPAATLELRDYLASRARLDQLGIFARYRFDLAPREDEAFDLAFRTAERDGWGDGTAGKLISLLRGIPFQTVYPEYFNAGRQAVNLEGMLRWDPEKQRARVSLAAPLAGNPERRWSLYLDARREYWDLTHTFHGGEAPVNRLALRRLAAGAELRSVTTNGWSWWSGLEASWRALPNREQYELTNDPLFTRGYALEYRAGASHDVVHIPERRIRLGATGEVATGRVVGENLVPFTRVVGGLEGRWLPQSRGEDYAVSASIRTGKLFGDAPFDELFMLGLERDNDLWMRGHIGTEGGRKGSAPLGRAYVLGNWEMDKLVYRGALWTMSLGPLLDTGTIRDGRSGFGWPLWLTDAGAQAKVRIFSGPTMILSWGKDLRTGGNAFYFTVKR